MNDPPGQRGPVGFMLLAIVSAAALCCLGIWQVQRFGWKKALIAERKSAYSSSPADLVATGAKPPEWRRVRLTGQFDHAKSLVVGLRSWRGGPHWRLVTAFRRTEGGWILVDRGWAPRDWRGAVLDRPEGTVTVEGIVRYPPAPGPFTPLAPPNGYEWTDIQPSPMAARLNVSGRVEREFWVAASPSSGHRGYPVADSALVLPRNNHLGYALTWFGLAASVLGVAGLYWRRFRGTIS